MLGENPQSDGAAMTHDNLGRWLREGARSAAFRAVRWDALRVTPLRMAGLMLAVVALGVVLQRLAIVEDQADFWWQALLQGWWSSLIALWLCWMVTSARQPTGEPTAAQLFALLIAQAVTIGAAGGIAQIAASRVAPLVGPVAAAWAAWGAWLLMIGWLLAAQSTLLWRASGQRRWMRALLVVVTCGAGALHVLAPPTPYWQAVAPGDSGDAAANEQRPRLTQEIVEAQPQLLEQQLRALAPQRAGIVDLYAISFAPYGGEDVFRRESEMVASVLQQRFNADGRTLQLVNHEHTAQLLPWATPLNLRRAIERVAATMDGDEDVLLIHLTSHGAHDGRLATGDWPPIALDPVTPAELRSWLDAAGISYRVVSVSACYSGSWIAPLAGPNTLVMTASDAEHTSYGCGRRSELTYFGRALYDEQLRHHTLSFERAMAAARPLIEQREIEAGKSDGYSNPQIALGDAVRDQLQRLQHQLEGSATR